MDELAEPKTPKDENLSFVRKFRWVLESEIKTNSGKVIELPYSFVNKVKIKESKDKFLTFNLIEAFDKEKGCLIYTEWLNQAKNFVKNNFPEETISNKDILEFRLIRYNGCGEEIYRDIFYDAKFVSEESEFDYTSSELSVKTITFSYSYKTTKIPANKEALIIYEMALSYSDNEKEIFNDVVTKNKFELLGFERPNMFLKEKFSDLDACPENKYSLSVGLVANEKNGKEIINIANQKFIRTLEFDVKLNNEKTETWKVDFLYISSVEFDDKYRQFTISFAAKNCYYTNYKL